MNPHKSTAGATALVALSELYRGLAALDVIDTTRLSPRGELPPDATRERAKLSEALAHFAAASDALARAIDVCAAFQGAAKEPRRSGADCDARAFERLQAAVERLRGAGGTIVPPIQDLEGVLDGAAAVATAWRVGAVSSSGSPGHPARGDTRP